MFRRYDRKENFIMEKISDSMKKILLAGIGAAATTAEKSKEILDDLVKKGELTVEQGKVLNVPGADRSSERSNCPERSCGCSAG